MADNPGTVTFDPHGDLHLQLSSGEDEHAETTILIVSSKASTLASPVFDRMLNSSFKEGLAKATESKFALALPEDNLEAMTIICQALHMNHLVSDHLTSSLLEKIAVLCNKYDCTKALLAHGRVWIRNGLDSNPGPCDLDRLLFTAYLLDIPETFAKVAWELVLTRVGRIVDLQVEIPTLFPNEILSRSGKFHGMPVLRMFQGAWIVHEKSFIRGLQMDSSSH